MAKPRTNQEIVLPVIRSKGEYGATIPEMIAELKDQVCDGGVRFTFSKLEREGKIVKNGQKRVRITQKGKAGNKAAIHVFVEDPQEQERLAAKENLRRLAKNPARQQHLEFNAPLSAELGAFIQDTTRIECNVKEALRALHDIESQPQHQLFLQLQEARNYLIALFGEVNNG